MISNKLKNRVKQFEGFRSRPYRCSANKLTIGYGFNLDDGVLPRIIANDLLEIGLGEAERAVYARWPEYKDLSENRRDVMTDMAFNLGISGLSKFVKMHRAIKNGDFKEAAAQLMDSLYAKQVGQRAVLNSELLMKESY